MLETAMLKVWSTEALWQIVNDTMQIYGGQAYFTDEPYERMMRDARINQIGEGANDVLRAFIALVGMRGVGEHLKGVLDAIKHPLKECGTLWSFGRSQVGSPAHHARGAGAEPARCARKPRELGKRVRDFGLAVQWRAAPATARRCPANGSTCRNGSPTRPANCTPRAAR